MDKFKVFLVRRNHTVFKSDLITYLDNRKYFLLKYGHVLRHQICWAPNTGHQEEIKGLLVLLGYPDKILTFADWGYGALIPASTSQLILLGPNDSVEYNDIGAVLAPLR